MRYSRWLFVVLISALLPATAANASFNNIIVFGDSLSDLGASPSAVMSAYKLLGNACANDFPCPPYFDGRISNGPVAVERLASLAGLNTIAGLQGYAIGGAMTNGLNYAVTGGPGMQQQLAAYLGSTGNLADANALYVVWGGANDFASAIESSPLGSLTGTATAAVDNLAGYVNTLIGFGARQFLVPGIPDLSLTPKAQEVAALLAQLNPSFAAAFLQNVSVGSAAFNADLAQTMAQIDIGTAASIVVYDVATLVNQAQSDPQSLGLSNATQACLVGDVPCLDPSNYLFWDGSHPTTQGHQLIGDRFFAAAIPEADMWAMLLVALPLVGWMVGRGRN